MNRKKSVIGRRAWIRPILGLLVLAGTILVFFKDWKLDLYGVQTIATLESTHVADKNRLVKQYRFMVDGQTYRIVVNPTDVSSDSVKVTYLPSDPTTNRLKPVNIAIELVGAGVVIIGFLLVGCFYMFVYEHSTPV